MRKFILFFFRFYIIFYWLSRIYIYFVLKSVLKSFKTNVFMFMFTVLAQQIHMGTRTLRTIFFPNREKATKLSDNTLDFGSGGHRLKSGCSWNTKPKHFIAQSLEYSFSNIWNTVERSAPINFHIVHPAAWRSRSLSLIVNARSWYTVPRHF